MSRQIIAAILWYIAGTIGAVALMAVIAWTQTQDQLDERARVEHEAQMARKAAQADRWGELDAESKRMVSFDRIAR